MVHQEAILVIEYIFTLNKNLGLITKYDRPFLKQFQFDFEIMFQTFFKIVIKSSVIYHLVEIYIAPNNPKRIGIFLSVSEKPRDLEAFFE